MASSCIGFRHILNVYYLSVYCQFRDGKRIDVPAARPIDAAPAGSSQATSWDKPEPIVIGRGSIPGLTLLSGNIAPMSLEDLYRKPGHLIRRLQQIAVALFVAECEALDLTPVQYASLAAIRDVPGLDVTRLSSLVALDKATLAKAIERLEAKGWIFRTSSDLDKRVKLLRIAPRGRKVLEAAEPRVRRCQRRILAPLAEPDRQSFMRMLERLVEVNNGYSRAPAKALRNTRSRPLGRRSQKSGVGAARSVASKPL